jgi:putative mycofactocin binding protein MftB
VESIEYLVPDWVRVRRESFGLLFYDTRSTRLTFVRSGEALEPPPFVGGDRRLRVMAAGGQPAVARLLSDLVAKGLLVVREAGSAGPREADSAGPREAGSAGRQEAGSAVPGGASRPRPGSRGRFLPRLPSDAGQAQ